MLFCVWLPWIPQCRWIHKRKMPKRSALILTAMLAAFCLLALAVIIMFAVACGDERGRGLSRLT